MSVEDNQAKAARKMAEDEACLKAESEVQIRETQAEEVARRMAEWEQGLKAQSFALRKAGEEQLLRMEAEIKRRSEAEVRIEGPAAKAEAEAEAHRTAEEIRLRAEEQARRRTEAEARLNEEEGRLQVEEEGRFRREEESQRFAEEFRHCAESEWGSWAGIEARFQRELEAPERAVIGTQLLAEDGRPQAVEAARRRRVEAETRLIEAEGRLQDQQNASARDEEEPQCLAEKTRKRVVQQAIRLAEAEAQLREEEAQHQSGYETRAKAEIEALRDFGRESERFEIKARLRAKAEASLPVEEEHNRRE